MKKLLIICCLFIGITTVSRAQAPKVGTDPIEKAKDLQKLLSLSTRQTKKVSAIYKESVQMFDKIKVKEHGNTNKIFADVAPLRVSTIKKIKRLLTPGQAIKYDKLVKESKKSSLNSGWGEGWSPASN